MPQQLKAWLIEEAQRTGEVDRGVMPVPAAYHIFSAYYAALVGWLGGTIPVRENQLAMLRSGLELLHRGLAPRPREPK